MGWLEDIGKSLPIEKIYDDLARKSVVQVGDIALNSIKAARCILAPIDYLAAQQDKLQNHLKRVNDKVPENRQINAHPLLTGPIIDNLKYVEEESLISEMFENLLARAIDRERASEAHPAFSKIIAQLSPDEAVILYHFKNQSYEAELNYIYAPNFEYINSIEILKNQFPVELLTFPNNYIMYLNHLCHLNLLTQFNNMLHMKESSPYNQKRCIETTKTTTFGQLFSQACIPEKTDLFKT
ncbi:Abi-alpha family protein [Marinomonas sp.]|uniref:Abi-alpha family protein n=1 Tax=Marinomonas sp. TaxID=1904862 RepID=UPI003A8D1DBB